MSFFGNTKNMGIVVLIAGIICLIGGIISAVGTLTAEGGDNLAAKVLIALGALVLGVGLLWCGSNILKADDGSEALRIFVRTYGLIIIVSAVLSLIGAIVGENTVNIITFVVQIVLGAIILWIGNKIGGKNKNVISSVLWVLLILVFIILALARLVSAVLSFEFGSLEEIGTFTVHVCMCIAFLMALVLTLSPDVKNAML